MGSSIEITIPQYVEEIKLTDSRRKKYYKQGDEIPKRFLTGDSLKHPYVFKKGRVYNYLTKEFAFSNVATHDKPRMHFIAGNDIWGGRNKHIQQAITVAIKACFVPHLPTKINLKFPIMIDMEVYAVPRYGNWDIGNLWPYEKIFEDTLQEAGLIPNDNIQYVTKSGSPRYIPIVNDSDRKMVFTLREDVDPRVISHVMYDLNSRKSIVHIDLEEDFKQVCNKWYKRILFVRHAPGEPGSTTFDKSKGFVEIGAGKRSLNWGGVRKGLRSTFSLAVQQNSCVVMSGHFYELFKQFVDEELADRGLTVYVYEGGDDIQGDSGLQIHPVQDQKS